MIIPLLIALLIPLSLHGMDHEKQREWEKIKPHFVKQALDHANISIYNPKLLPIVEESEITYEEMARRRTCSAAPMVQHCYEAITREADKMSVAEKDVILALWHNQLAKAQIRTIEGILNPFLRRYALQLAEITGSRLIPHSQ